MSQTSPAQTQRILKIEILARDAGVALIIKLAGIVLTYLVQIFLARWMGKTEYGTYEYVMSWTLLLAIPAGLGLPHTVLRSIAEYRVRENWGSLRGIVRGSWLLTMLASLFISLGITVIILLLDRDLRLTYSMPLLIGVWMVPLHALMQLQLEMARSLDDITLAYWPGQLGWPVLILSGGFILWQKNHSLTSVPTIAMVTLALLTLVLFQLGLLWEKLNREVEAVPPIYAFRNWLGISLPLLIQGAFLIILNRTDILMLGSLVGPEAAGIYSAATKTAMWASFFLQTLNMVAAPAFATFYAQEDLPGLQKTVSTVALWIFWPTLGISLCLLTFAQPVLGLFGPEFVTASWEMKILILGRLVDALCGSVNYLMIMTGHQNKSVTVFGCSALVNIVLNAIAIPLLGSLGAAMTTTFTVALWNIWLTVLVVRNVGVNPSVFNSLLKTW